MTMTQQDQQAQTEAAEPMVPAGYKQTEVGVIPDDWECLEIGALNPFVTSGSRGWAAFYAPAGDLFVRITNMSRESIYLDLNNVRYVSVGSDSSEGNRTSLKNNDILISITADIGICSFVDDSLIKPAFINQHIALVRLDGELVHSRFIAYFLSSHQIQKLFKGSTDQGAKAGMNLDAVRKIKTAIPPLEEQTAIANVLSDVDAMFGSLEALIAKKQAIKTATMQQLLTGHTRLPQFATHPDGSSKGYKTSELGKIPKDWEAATLGQISEVRMCKRVLSMQTSETGDIPFFKIGTFGEQPDAYIKFGVYEDFRKKYSFPKVGDILISAAGTLGKTVVYDGKPAYFQDSNIVWLDINKAKLLNEYLYHYYKVIKWASSEGSTIARLYNGIIRASLIALPSLQEQTAIATILSDMDEDIQTLKARLAKTRDLKQGMMQQLLTGKVRLPVEEDR